MNDTIMASLAAAKSNKHKPQTLRRSDFRSVRASAGEKVKKVRLSNGLDDGLPSISSLTLHLEADVVRQLKASSPDPAGLAQQIIRDHLRKLKD